jgi:hypothetical protein
MNGFNLAIRRPPRLVLQIDHAAPNHLPDPSGPETGTTHFCLNNPGLPVGEK